MYIHTHNSYDGNIHKSITEKVNCIFKATTLSPFLRHAISKQNVRTYEPVMFAASLDVFAL